MADTPPHRPSPPASPANPPGDQLGDGAVLTPTEARSAQKSGRVIWVLVVSLGLIVVLFAGYWALNAPRMQAVNHPSGRDLNAHDISTYQAPSPQPKGTPPGGGPNTGD